MYEVNYLQKYTLSETILEKVISLHVHSHNVWIPPNLVTKHLDFFLYIQVYFAICSDTFSKIVC
jgi:hypothetical protein